MALLALHEQDLVFGRLEDLGGLGHRRRVDPVLGIHEKFAGILDRGPGGVHLLEDALIHQRLRHMLADRLLVTVTAEIAGKGLFADDVLSGLHARDDHLGMEIGRRADVDHVKVAIPDHLRKAAIDTRDVVAGGKGDDMVAARGDRHHLDIDAIDAPKRIHMQLRLEAAADESDPDPGHGAPLIWSAL